MKVFILNDFSDYFHGVFIVYIKYAKIGHCDL